MILYRYFGLHYLIIYNVIPNVESPLRITPIIFEIPLWFEIVLWTIAHDYSTIGRLLPDSEIGSLGWQIVFAALVQFCFVQFC